MRDSFQQQQVVASALPRSLSLVAAAAVTAGLAVVKGHAILPWATLPPSRLRCTVQSSFAHCVCQQYDSMAFDSSTRLIRQLDSRSRPCVLGIQCKLLLHRCPQNSELFRGAQSSRSASGRVRHHLVRAGAKGAFEVVYFQFVLKVQLMLTCCYLQLQPKQRRKQIRNDGRNQAVELVLWTNGTDSLLLDDLLNDSALGNVYSSAVRCVLQAVESELGHHHHRNSCRLMSKECV